MKNMEIIKKNENFTLPNEHHETIWRLIFNSTCPPSGNLVDGFPFDLHNTDAVGY